jgi:hypothetical protein
MIIVSPYRILVFLYSAAILAVVYLLDVCGFSAGVIIAVASALVVLGVAMMLKRCLADA